MNKPEEKRGFRGWVKPHRVGLCVWGVIVIGLGLLIYPWAREKILLATDPEYIPPEMERILMQYLWIEDEERLPQDVLDQYFQQEDWSVESPGFAVLSKAFVDGVNTLYGLDYSVATRQLLYRRLL
ncbi:MAG: hypothetical protein LBT60_01235 [Oscillospiraceae bacterium]|jgi:hypothetical protein|nr:hypothetical protein [Oscillospiraceae bacterium]